MWRDLPRQDPRAFVACVCCPSVNRCGHSPTPLGPPTGVRRAPSSSSGRPPPAPLALRPSLVRPALAGVLPREGENVPAQIFFFSPLPSDYVVGRRASEGVPGDCLGRPRLGPARCTRVVSCPGPAMIGHLAAPSPTPFFASPPCALEVLAPNSGGPVACPGGPWRLLPSVDRREVPPGQCTAPFGNFASKQVQIPDCGA